MFLAPEKVTSKHHVLPRISPRSHHQKTTFNHPLFPKPPSKTQQNCKIPRHRQRRIFSKNEAKHPGPELAPQAVARPAP
jgi:hypothetical protein